MYQEENVDVPSCDFLMADISMKLLLQASFLGDNRSKQAFR